jgi:hypothetical protein
MKKLFYRSRLSLFLPLFSFSCAGMPTLPPAEPKREVPEQSILQMRNYLDVVDDNIFIQKEDFPGEVELENVIGKEKNLLLVTQHGEAIPISVKSSKKFGDCNGYPSKAFVVEVEKATLMQTKGHLNGLAFPLGSRLITTTSDEASGGFKKVAAMHFAYVQKINSQMFPNYENIIRTDTVAIRMSNGKIFFWTPNPAMDNRNDRAYLWDEGSGTALPVKLYSRITCST